MTNVLRFDKGMQAAKSLLVISALLALLWLGTPARAQIADFKDVACYVSPQTAQQQGTPAPGQTPQPKGQSPNQQPPSPGQAPKPPSPQAQGETKITPEQAQELFRSVDEILRFASKDTQLPIQHSVKRELANREQVRKFVLTHMQEDRDAQRLQRSEASMKKFGLLPREFDLRKFMLDLLEDQVAGYYDTKTKTVYLLDWVEPEAQRPVLAHELTHALQDQNFNLEKWLKVRPDADKHENPDNLDTGADEQQAARQAVSEGQGMAVMMDYMLEPSGHSLADSPLVGEVFKQNTMEHANDSPIFARAPMYLREMVIFPYVYGLSFLEDLLTKGGKEQAFTGVFKNPPHDTREIMQPKSYLDGQHVEPLRLPKLSGVLKKNYAGYDSGSVGEFDVYVLLKQYSGADLADKLSTAWRGGVYYLGRKKESKAAGSGIPAMGDLGLLYVSDWATAQDAGYFAKAYSLWLPKKYKSVKAVPEQAGHAWTTDEGPVYIETAGSRVLVMEGLDADTATAVRQKVLIAPSSAWIPQHTLDLTAPVWATLHLFH